MTNGLLDLREKWSEPLSSEVHFGLALAVWQRVNEKPPLVPFERQSLSCAGIQRQPLPGNLPDLVPKVPTHCGQITERRQHHTGITLGVGREWGAQMIVPPRSYNPGRRPTSSGETPVARMALRSSPRPPPDFAKRMARTSPPSLSSAAKSMAVRLLRSGDKSSHSEAP